MIYSATKFVSGSSRKFTHFADNSKGVTIIHWKHLEITQTYSVLFSSSHFCIYGSVFWTTNTNLFWNFKLKTWQIPFVWHANWRSGAANMAYSVMGARDRHTGLVAQGSLTLFNVEMCFRWPCCVEMYCLQRTRALLSSNRGRRWWVLTKRA